MKNWLFATLIIVFGGIVAIAQPRPIEKAPAKTADIKPAPASFSAKYEGGIFGYNDKESGTLRFDDVNERIIFFGEDQKERFGIPYKSLLIVYSDEKSVTSTTGNVVSAIPIAGAGLGKLIREKRVYLVLQYDDPDVDAKGTTSFKLTDRDLIESVVHTLGTKAKLKQRGEAYVRPRVIKTESN